MPVRECHHLGIGLPLSTTLDLSPPFVIPGGTLSLVWTIGNWRDGLTGFSLLFTVPDGFTSLGDTGALDPKTELARW